MCATSDAVEHAGNVMISMDLCEQLIEVITTRQAVSDAVRDRISGLSTCWSGPYTLLQLIQGKNAKNRHKFTWKARFVL